MAKLRRQTIRFWIAMPLLGILCVSCKTTQQKTSVAKAPTAEVPKASPESPGPVLPETPAEPAPVNIQPEPTVDPVESLIQRSQESFLRGEKNLKAGFLE